MSCFGPAVLAGPESSTEATTAANTAFTQRSSLRSSLGASPNPQFSHSACRRTEAQASCLHYGFVNAQPLGAMPFCAQVYEPEGEEPQKMDAVPHPVSLVFEGQKGRSISQQRRALSFFGFLSPPPFLSWGA